MEIPSPEQLRAKKLIVRRDPVLFTERFLKLKVWDGQAEIMRAVAEHERVSVRSGHKIGKSTSACSLALWWVCTRPRGRVVMTSASFRQVKSILWKELRRLYHGAVGPIGGRLAEDPETGLQLEDGREVVGFSTNEPERMAGISGEELLFIIDEASGVPEAIFEAIEGNRAGGAQVVMFSNPTRTAGTFFDAFHSKSEFWKTIHVSSRDTPNVRERRRVIPGLATHEWVEEKLKEWGQESSLFQVRVEGNFPTQGDNAVIALQWVEDAIARWEDTPAEGRLHIGVDVARFGDDESVIRGRRGNKALEQLVLQGMDTEQVAGRVLDYARSHRLAGEVPFVKVDVIGVGGGVVDKLRRCEEVEVAEVNVAEAAKAEGYSKLRDQLWFALADWLKAGGSYEHDTKLDAELVAPTYGFDAQGRRKVASKDEIRKVLNRSPDRADALALAVYEAPESWWV